MKAMLNTLTYAVSFCFFLSTAFNLTWILGFKDLVMTNDSVLIICWVMSVIFSVACTFILNRWILNRHHQ